MIALQCQIDRDVIWSMLQGIPAYDRDIWIKIGMALKSELGNNGFSLFDDWSSTADNYDPKAVKAVWKSFKGNGVAIGSLIQLAKENGWQRDNKTTEIAPEIKPSPKPVKSNTQSYALRLWMLSNKDDSYIEQHPYSINKGIEWAGGAGRGIASSPIKIGINSDCIIVPIRTNGTGKAQGVQCINAQGRKQTFGDLSDGYLLLGNTLDKTLSWYVCEGWASAVSMVFHHQKGNGICAVSFGKSNLDRVAKQMASDHQPDEVIIIREDDS
ncbi:MAG: hypothetical protein HOM14_03670 [Gammaproteobacteria bacterium]|nr:hypothetical protein [Gammaproteobacteria bacterium]MBT4196316.1 hypothetical protein [Gammaproteobacteria bacterium]MBT4451278.1 hypothetical protein [Gammaproteobacteria bacterium]MBT4859169.1 hypothetical protein [Gammaproteobacteria bacterium]MBT6550434.1 hypothetical protein [Gammaproteobacteria bacterium]